MKAGPNSRNHWGSAWFEVKDYPSGSYAQRNRKRVIARVSRRGYRAAEDREILRALQDAYTEGLEVHRSIHPAATY